MKNISVWPIYTYPLETYIIAKRYTYTTAVASYISTHYTQSIYELYGRILYSLSYNMINSIQTQVWCMYRKRESLVYYSAVNTPPRHAYRILKSIHHRGGYRVGIYTLAVPHVVLTYRKECCRDLYVKLFIIVVVILLLCARAASVAAYSSHTGRYVVPAVPRSLLR